MPKSIQYIQRTATFVYLTIQPAMQRYIITERRGTDGLRLEKDAEVPQLNGPNDVSTEPGS